MNTYSKTDFLAKFSENELQSDENDFLNYLGALIAGEEFIHSYAIEHKAWCKAHRSNTWSCNTLVDAKNKYWWHGFYAENAATLEQLSFNLKQSIKNESEHDIFYHCVRTLEWGDVYKGCISYVLDQYEARTLGSSIREAVDILENTEYKVHLFSQSHLRMDSGLTKVFSLASSKSTIMDSRVAAALTLIACRFFTQEQLCSVKELYAFACGKTSGKKPKRSQIRGENVFSPILQPKNQAHFNLVTNWILDAALVEAKQKNSDLYTTWKVSNDSELLRAVEASLFMIGSDITSG